MTMRHSVLANTYFVKKLCFQTLQYVLCTSLEKSPQTNPIIGRIECKAGHGAGRPTQKMVRNLFASKFVLRLYSML